MYISIMAEIFPHLMKKLNLKTPQTQKTDTCNNMDELQKHHVRQNKPYVEEFTFHEFFMQSSSTGKINI
jgi:hypothetical protein